MRANRYNHVDGCSTIVDGRLDPHVSDHKAEDSP